MSLLLFNGWLMSRQGEGMPDSQKGEWGSVGEIGRHYEPWMWFLHFVAFRLRGFTEESEA